MTVNEVLRKTRYVSDTPCRVWVPGSINSNEVEALSYGYSRNYAVVVYRSDPYTLKAIRADISDFINRDHPSVHEIPVSRAEEVLGWPDFFRVQVLNKEAHIVNLRPSKQLPVVGKYVGFSFTYGSVHEGRPFFMVLRQYKNGKIKIETYLPRQKMPVLPGGKKLLGYSYVSSQIDEEVFTQVEEAITAKLPEYGLFIDQKINKFKGTRDNKTFYNFIHGPDMVRAKPGDHYYARGNRYPYVVVPILEASEEVQDKLSLQVVCGEI